LHDLIKAEVLPVIELNKVFRQAMESKIISNAHKIVAGEMPDLKNDGKDFFHMERQSPYHTAQTVAELCSVRLKKAYNWDPLSDIQVICPSKKGETGTINLNKILQGLLNPQDTNKQEIIISGQLFREGDKVMQTKNNYNVEWESEDDKGTGIFNGDIGILEKINTQNGLVTINFDGRIAEIAAENLSELDLSYAITVHKSQGSEFRAVIIPVMGVVSNLAHRNLLYTAVTRAKDMLITVGSGELIYKMTANDKKAKRYSALSHFLKAEF
jgi:exodeoxyribonuclease V alpha subunit